MTHILTHYEFTLEESRNVHKLLPNKLFLFLFCSKSWVNLYCVLSKGGITFYKDAKSTTTPYNEETPLDLSVCICDSTMGYKKKKNVFVIKYGLMKRIFFYSTLFLILAYNNFLHLKTFE